MTSRPKLSIVLAALALAPLNLAWSPQTTREIAWRAVEFFPPDLARQVRKNHRYYDQGLREGLRSPPAWRAGPPGHLADALADQADRCARDLRRPVPLSELTRELGVLAVRVADANDPLAVAHDDAREPAYAAAYEAYVNSILDRVRIVYYGRDRTLRRSPDLSAIAARIMNRSRSYYTLIGQEFYRTGHLRSWKTFDDLSVTFGIAGICLSHAVTDLANLAAWIWRSGGGLVPTPLPTPMGHVGPTITVGLGGGFPERNRRRRGRPAMPPSSIQLPPP